MLRNLFRWPKLAAAGLSLAALLALIACGSDPTATPLPPTATAMPPTATPAPTATPPPPTATPVPPTATPAPTATAVPPTATPVPPMGMMQPGQSLIPEGAQFIIDLWPQALMDSPFLEEMAMMLEIDTESLIDDAAEATCLEPEESIDYLQMYLPADLLADFGDLTGLAMDPDAADDAMDAMWDELPDFGIALYGGFDQAEVMPCLAASPDAASYEMSQHRGYDIYTSDADGTSLAFAAANVMLLGTPAAVEAMLDVAAGAAPAAAGPVVDALESLGERHIGFSQETPPGLMESAMDMMPEQGLLGALDFSAMDAPVNATGILLGDGIEVVSVSVYDDLAAASAAKEYTEGLLAMTAMMFAEAPELAQLTSGLEISQDGSSVTTRIAITAATIEMLMELLGSGMMMMPSDN